MDNKKHLTAAEAVLAFAAWLTDQPEAVVFSKYAEAQPCRSAVRLFFKANGLDEKDIRPDWVDIYIRPKEGILSDNLKLELENAFKGLDDSVKSAISSNDEVYKLGVHESWGSRAVTCYDVLQRIFNLLK